MNEGELLQPCKGKVGWGGRGGRGTSFMQLHTKLLGDVTSRKGIPGKGRIKKGERDKTSFAK